VIPSEALEIDYEDRWHVVYLNLLHGLFVIEAAVAVPCVGLRQLLRPIELPEAVVNTDAFG